MACQHLGKRIGRFRTDWREMDQLLRSISAPRPEIGAAVCRMPRVETFSIRGWGLPGLDSMDKRNIVLFVLLIALLMGQGLALLHTITALENRQRALRHSADVSIESAGLLSSLKDIETGQRGYLLTSNITYLEPYQSAVVDSDTHLRRLNELLDEDAELQ